MLYKIDVFKNFAKCTGNRLDQTPAQRFSWEFFKDFRNTFFMKHFWVTACYFNPIFLLFLDIFVSEQINICLIFQPFQGISKFMARDHWLLFLHRVNTIGVKITLVLKKVLNMPAYTAFWICLNIPDFVWLYIPGYVWVYQNMHEFS